MPNINLTRGFGIAGIIAAASFLAAFITFGVTDPVSTRSGEEATWLPELADEQNVRQTLSALFMFGGFFVVPLVFGLSRVLRSPLSQLAFVAFVVSVVLLFIQESLGFPIVQFIAPAYGDAGAQQPTLEALARSLDEMREVVGGISTLILGAGVLLYGIEILRSGALPRWVGWYSLVSAVLVFDSIFGIFVIWLISLIIWLLIIGSRLILRPELGGATDH